MIKKIKQLFRKRHDKQKIDPTLLEQMNRNSPEDQVEIGTIVENALSGSFGNVLNLIINGIIDEELDLSRGENNIPADRVLGRIESLNKLQDRLDMCVQQKQSMQEELKEGSSVSDADSIETAAGPQAE